MKSYRITNRFRFTVFVVLIIIMITTLLNFALGFNTADSLTKVDYRTVQVSSGDTLWSQNSFAVPTVIFSSA